MSQLNRRPNGSRTTIDGMNATNSSAVHPVVLIVISAVAIPAVAQTSIKDVALAQDTQVRGYWVDPSTGLMWAGKDNGKDVSWNKAMKYCRDLRLAGYSDWRLASVGELEGIYDKNANAPGFMGPSGKGTDSAWHVKGDLFLTVTGRNFFPRSEQVFSD